MLTKENTLQIKGAAILCMIGLHLFANPDRIPIESPEWFGSPITKALQICVPVYLFMAGYGLQCGANKEVMTVSILWSRLKKIYTAYWWVFVPFVGIGLAIGYYPFDWLNFSLTAIGLKCTYNGEWWFYSLYVELLILYHGICRIKAKWWQYLGLMVVLLVVTRMLNGRFDFGGNAILTRQFNMIMIDLNTFMMGCFFAKYDVYRFLNDWFKIPSLPIGVTMVIIPIIGRAYGPLIGVTELFLVPMFCYGVVMICRLGGARILSFFGKHSTNLWLIHSFFIFYYLNGVTMLTNNPVMMFVTVVGCSVCCSMVIKYCKKIVGRYLSFNKL